MMRTSSRSPDPASSKVGLSLATLLWLASPVPGEDCNANGIPDAVDISEPIPALVPTGLVRGVPQVGPLLVADLDGDGDEDAAMADDELFADWVQLENREGVLTRREPLYLDQAVFSMAAGDREGDGDLDVFCLGLQGLTLLQNSGGWRFQLQRLQVPRFSGPDLATGDIDQDGSADLAILGPRALITLLGSGDGTYRAGQQLPLPSEPRRVLLVDLDGDGGLDAAIANRLGNVSVSLNQGAGSLARARNYAAGGERRAIAAADLDGDSDVDLVTAGLDPAVTLLRNRGNGTFPQPQSLLDELSATRVMLADIDLDATQDLIAAIEDPHRMVGRLGQGRAELGPPLRLELRWELDALAAIELTPGAPPAILSHFPQSREIEISGLGETPPSTDRDENGIPDECQGARFRRGDAGGDGIPDVIDAIFLLGHLFLGMTGPRCREAADYNNDGHLDLLDALELIEYLYQQGQPPPAPAFDCGFDTDPPGSPRDLGCVQYRACE